MTKYSVITTFYVDAESPEDARQIVKEGLTIARNGHDLGRASDWHVADSSADELAEALDDLLASVPPRHAFQREVEAFERAQSDAAFVLAHYREGR